jgi:phosphoglycerate dehydrogenase-like enzyme
MTKRKVLITFDYPGLKEVVDSVQPFSATVATDRDRIVTEIRDAEVVCAAQFDRELLSQATQLRWIQAFMAGVEKILFPELIASPVPLTCVKECFAIPGAEHAMAAILAVTYRFDYYIRQQTRRQPFEWQVPSELHGKTIGIIGFGNIGRTLAHRVKAFGARVLAVARRAHPDPAPADHVWPIERLHDLFRESDFVVLAIPLTPESRGLIGAREIAQMKPTGWLIDISGRAALLDLPAIIDALKEKKIGGADLQFPQPPPSDSPMWDLPNLIMSQWSANSQEESQRSMNLFKQNLIRYRDGQPLLDLVDKHAGY